MAWIESHQSLGRHPKTKAAARALGISRVEMVGHLHYLWWWALDFAESGDLSGIDPNDIAEEAMWEGDPATFLDVLTRTGFLTDDHHINDWDDYTGRLVAQRESNRERQRRHREKAKEDAQNVTSQTPEHDVTVTSPLRNGATIPNHTVPTKPNPTMGDTPTPPAAPAKSSGYPADFELWWAAYPPGHGVKKAAYEHWKKIKPDAAMVQVLIHAVDGWQQSDRWKRGFVMDAQRWLRDRAWESVPPPQPTNGALTVHNGGRRDLPGRDGRTDAERGYRLDPGPKGWSADELARMSMDDYRTERSGT